MQIKRITSLLFIFLFLSTGLLVSSVQAGQNTVTENEIAPEWTCNLTTGGNACGSDSTDNSTGHVPSPVIADVNGDGVDDIIIATNGGLVTAVKNNGSSGVKLWNTDIAPAFGMSAGTQVIESSPAVADLDGDGFVEIVVGAGKEHGSTCMKGGVIVLDHDGSVRSGWPQYAADQEISPTGCPDPIYGSPALGDLDNDGTLEIVVGGFDKRIYAWHQNGQLVNGFPLDSYLVNRFPGWADLYGHIADTIWSSPALADIDDDGYLDIILGTDEGNFDASWEGDAQGWTCPYESPTTAGYCGGSLYAINRFGDILPNFPIYTLEHIQSTPALYDIDMNGSTDILVGSGTYFNTNSPDHPTYGFRLFGWDYQGGILPGWGTQGAAVGERGGVITGGTTPASPAIGDIDGDGYPEVVALSMDKKLYAWNHDGTVVAGFPQTPKDQNGTSYEYNAGLGITLADMDNDGAMEIFIPTAWSITIFDGSGNQLTTTHYPPNNPFYYARGTLRNMPAFGDTDGDGKLEMIVNNSNLYVWEFDNAGKADWPMYKQNAARTSYAGEPLLHTSPSSFTRLHLNGDTTDVTFNMSVGNAGIGCFDWTATATELITVSLSPTSGEVCEGEQTAVSVTIDTTGLSMGANDMGVINVIGQIASEDVKNSPQSIPLTIYLVNDIYNTYLPIIKVSSQ